MISTCSTSLASCSLKAALYDLRRPTNRSKYFVARRLIRSITTDAEVFDHKAPKAAKPKASAAPKIPNWQLKAVANLANDLKRDGAHFRAKAARQAAVSELIRYAVNEDYSSLVAFAMQYVGSAQKSSSNYRGDDEFFAVVLLLAARGLQKFTTATLVDDAASASLFYSTATLFERMSFEGNRVRSAALVLLNSMEKWTDLRSIDERSSDIDRTYEELQRKSTKEFGYWYPIRDRLLINDANEKIVDQRLTNMLGKAAFAPSAKRDYKYAKDQALVATLNSSVDKSDFLGAPFHCEELTENDYLERFRQQQLIEASHTLHVRNPCRKSDKITAEKLVEQWGWKSSIENVLSHRISQLRHFTLKGYLSMLNLSDCAHLMLSSVLAACSSGQDLAVYSSFIYSLVEPIFDSFYNKFADRLGIKRHEIAEEVFLRYVQYFLDSEIARQYTQREWWMHCCFESSVAPDFSPPFADVLFDMRAELGSFLLSVVIEACRFPKKTGTGRDVITPAFSIRELSIEEASVLVESNRVDLVKMVQIDKALMQLLREHQFEWLIFPSNILPMIHYASLVLLKPFSVPPRPWIDRGDGGPSYNRSSDVVRSLEEYEKFRVNDEMKKRLRNRTQARPVFDALNDLGTTPWKVNKDMLQVLKQLFEMTGDTSKEKLLNTLSIPLKAETVDIPDFVKTFGEGVKFEDIPNNEWISFSKAKYEALKRRGELNSLWFWLMYRVALAECLQNEILYFPHNMDFRGRVYPISPYLSHMGDDVNRSLLLFAKGKPLGIGGLNWLKLHCINLTGKKKRAPIAARLAYAEEMLPQILDSANNPLDGKQWWLESDEPWQTLATCMEIRNALHCENHESYVSHFPVHQDGTCNGLQHYAALGRDRDGAKEVNLLPYDSPSDVYSGVAQRVEQKRIEDEKSAVENIKELALSLRKAMPETVPRKVIKQTVMTTVYGVTMYGAVQQIKRQLKAKEIDFEQCSGFASYLAQKTFMCLNESFTSSMMIKDWFRTCAQTVSRLMFQPVEWITPLGLPVVQPYLRLQQKFKKLAFIPVPIKQTNAFPPNFVHSLDSTHMMLTTLHCRRRGITFAAVHDCYWSHACTVDEMNKICRDQFINLHKQPIVEQCGKFFCAKYLNSEIGRMMPAETHDYFKDVFTPKFSFGDLDIEEKIPEDLVEILEGETFLQRRILYAGVGSI